MERPLAYVGSCFTVAFAVAANKTSPAEEFYDSDLSELEQAKMLKLFERMGNAGRISNRENFKKIENDL